MWAELQAFCRSPAMSAAARTARRVVPNSAGQCVTANSVSVIVCTWNRSASLRQTLLSLNEQIGCEGGPVEVIVVDNNSSDDTKSVVDSFLPHWKLGDLRYAFEQIQGKQFALNHGIRIARNAILAFTDDDVVFRSDWIRQARLAFDDETLDLAGGKTLLIWPDGGPPSWFAPDMSAVAGGLDLGEAWLDPPPPGYAPAGANLIARRALFDRVGLYSEAHFRHMDYEFGLRCVNAGAHVAYDPGLVVHTPVARATITKRYFRRWSFKAGIAGDGSGTKPGPSILFVPRWVYRRWFEDLIFLLPRLSATDDAAVFSRELRLWRFSGTIMSLWHAKLRPSSHRSWIEKHSQKVKDVY